MNLPNDLSRAIGGRFGQCAMENAATDVIRIYDYTTGEQAKPIEILPLIAALGKKGDEIRTRFVKCDDPIHLNKIQVVKEEEQAQYFPNGKVGDLLISLRDVHTIALLDRDTHEIKWHVTGQFKSQHEPVITNHGTVIVFDNWGGDPANGASRIVEIDIHSRKTVGTYEATGDDYLQSNSLGKVAILNDNRILVEEQNPPRDTLHSATLFALDCPEPYISNECKKKMIFSGSFPKYQYTNVITLENDLPLDTN
jgi:hypothetical protein